MPRQRVMQPFYAEGSVELVEGDGEEAVVGVAMCARTRFAPREHWRDANATVPYPHAHHLPRH